MPLSVNWSRRARRFTLRLDGRTGGARITLPTHAEIEDALAFLRRHEGWLQQEFAAREAPVPFEPGARIPFLGVEHEIRMAAPAIRRVWAEAAEGGATGVGLPVLWVGGPPDMTAIRTARFLKTEARSALDSSARRHAGCLGVSFRRISVRDQATRWGSCSSTGTLSFSWRLVMAPLEVLDYVAAHEVAHLKEMNHSARFWRLVHQIAPHADEARAWLSTHGRSLHRYGASGRLNR